MFCSNCGNEVQKGLKYCNGCGGKMIKDEGQKKSKSIAEWIIIGGTSVIIFGFACLVGLVAIFFANGFPFEYVILVAVAFLLALTGISFIFLRPVSKLVNMESEKQTEFEETYQPPQLSEPTAARLNEPQTPVASVTEHTTRTLDKVLVERK